MLDSIVKLANSLGFGGFGMSVLFVVITTLVTIISGSNGASFYPLIEMVPHIAAKLNVSSVMLVLPMHQASTYRSPSIARRRRGRRDSGHAKVQSARYRQTLQRAGGLGTR